MNDGPKWLEQLGAGKSLADIQKEMATWNGVPENETKADQAAIERHHQEQFTSFSAANDADLLVYFESAVRNAAEGHPDYVSGGAVSGLAWEVATIRGMLEERGLMDRVSPGTKALLGLP